MVINMKMVVQIDNIEIYGERGNEYYFKCPVCGRKECKCSFNPTKGRIRDGEPVGVWRCFHCDSRGDAVSLHAAETGQTYESALDDLLGKDHVFAAVKNTYIENTVNESKKASAKILDSTYRDLCHISSLSSKHKADLLRRGLMEEDIKEFLFCDAPSDGVSVAQRLQNRGDDLDGVPGFYVNSVGQWTISGVKRSGYLCPVFSPDGKIKGFQKRLDDPGDGQKYVWFSSSGRNEGVTSGAPSTFLKGKAEGIVIVTEGILKATVTYCLLKRQFTVIGVPGVKVLNDFKTYLADKGIIKPDDLLVEAFDMDKCRLTDDAFDKAYQSRDKKYQNLGIDGYLLKLSKKQSQIEKDTEKLKSVISSYGRTVIPLSWDKTGSRWNGRYKGIDDILLTPDAPQALFNFLYYKKNCMIQARPKTA